VSVKSFASFVQQFGQAEVRDFHPAFFIEENVPWLDIADWTIPSSWAYWSASQIFGTIPSAWLARSAAIVRVGEDSRHRQTP